MASEPAPPDAAGAAQWHGVHPLSIAVNFLPRTWSLLRTAWPVLLAVLYGGRSQEGLVNAFTLVVFFALPFVSSTIHALTLRYRVVNGQLEIRSGLLNRQARSIPCDRVQNVEQVQNVFQRASGLVEVRVETASGREVEGLLSALSVDHATALVHAIDAERRLPDAGGAHPATVDAEALIRSSLVDLLWFGAADLRLGGVSMLLVLGLELVPDASRTLATGGPVLAGAVGIAAVTGAWLLGVTAVVVRYYGFALTRTRGALVAEQGLLTRRRTVLRRSKVQLVTWIEPLALRPFGLGALSIETAVAREQASGTERSVAVVPGIEARQAGALCAEALGDALGDAARGWGIDPTNAALERPHPAAGQRAVVAAATQWAVISTVVAAVAWPYGLVCWLAVPIAAALARIDVAYQGWLVTDALVIARRGVITRRTAVLPRAKLQSSSVEGGPIARAFGLGLLTLRVAGSRIELPALAASTALALQDALAGQPPEGGNPTAAAGWSAAESGQPG